MYVFLNKSIVCYYSYSGLVFMDKGCGSCIWFWSGWWSMDIGYEFYSKSWYFWIFLNKNLNLKLIFKKMKIDI